MGWFEEQIRLRCEKDGEALDEALKNVSVMIEGKKRQSFGDDREKIKTALDEVVSKVNSILLMCINGEDPATCEPSNCSGSCSTCGGCH